jgi:GNAT superfamily N-acetyltransferase
MPLLSLFARRPPGTPISAEEPEAGFSIAPDINVRLHRARLVPFLDQVRGYGRGKPGITRETEVCWILRDRWGRIIGAAKAIDGDPPALDIEISPEHRRKGHATRLYAAISAAGIDVEEGSDASLREGLMTPLGYAFQVGRRSKTPTA